MEFNNNELEGRNNKRIYKKNEHNHSGEEMYAYLENYLAETVKAHWERYKAQYPNEIKELIDLGNNPYNFVNKIHLLITGEDPNSGLLSVQQDAMKN